MAPSNYQVFLSHSHHDNACAKELHRRLTRDGLSCFLNTESIEWGDNWVLTLEQAIANSAHILVLLSPDFCTSHWSQLERTGALSLSRKLLPLIVHPCQDLPTFPLFLRPIQSIDVSTTSLFEQNYPRICRQLGGTPGNDTFLTPDRTKLPPVRPLPERHRMPHQSLGDQFIGRINTIWQLHDSLFHDNTTVLQGTGVVAGTGGLGKKQLAIEYAHRFGPAYPGGVYWVNADLGLTALITQVSTAATVEINTKSEEPDQIAQLWNALNARHLACLIILDNFPETIPLRPYLPTTGRLHTIITTRRQDLAQATVRLPVLTLEESIQLLNSGERQFGQSASPLTERLGGLPLALELSKSYLNYRQDLTIPALIKEMNAQGEVSILTEFANEYRDQLPSNHERDVVGTFQLSWNIAPDNAKQILRVMGELAPSVVPKKLLRIILNLPEQPAFHDPLSKGLAELARLSLVELSSNGDPIAHRLMIAFAHHRNVTDKESPFEKCREALQEQMERANDNPDDSTLRELELLLPHAESLASTAQLQPKNLGYLLSFIGIHHTRMGRFTAARRAHARALASDEKSFEPGHPSIAASQSNLAMVLLDLGQWEEARDLLGKALASDEKSFEPGHPSIAINQSNLALVLRDLGQWEEAHDLLRKALASAEKSFEPGHRSIATRQSNLATVLQDLGQLEEARDLLQKALASAEKSFEPGHPSIAINQSNLALVLRDLGQLDEARDLLRKALASDEKSFEPGHPSIARVQSNLALVLKDLGQWEEARDLLRKALASAEKSFEPGHPSIAISQSNLASVLRDLGQLEEAGDLLRRAYSSSLRQFGPDHPKTKRFKANLDGLPEQ